MGELEKKKHTILSELRGLCAHCSSGNRKPHRCPIGEISARIERLKGVPLIVNSEFRGVLWQAV